MLIKNKHYVNDNKTFYLVQTIMKIFISESLSSSKSIYKEESK